MRADTFLQKCEIIAFFWIARVIDWLMDMFLYLIDCLNGWLNWLFENLIALMMIDWLIDKMTCDTRY